MEALLSLWRGTIQSVFWHYQFARNQEVRKFLYERSQEDWADEDLSYKELWWCLEKENYETLVLA